MNLDLGKILENKPTYAAVWPKFYPKSVGALFFCSESREHVNRVGLGLSILSACGHFGLPKLFGELDTMFENPRFVTYLSLDDTEATLANTIHTLTTPLSQESKKLLQKNARVAVLSPVTLITELQDAILTTISKDPPEPALLVVNAARYISINQNEYGFIPKFLNILWGVSVQANIAVLALAFDYERKAALDQSMAWVGTIRSRITDEKTLAAGHCFSLDSPHFAEKIKRGTFHVQPGGGLAPCSHNKTGAAVENAEKPKSCEIQAKKHVIVKTLTPFPASDGQADFDRLTTRLPVQCGIPLKVFTEGIAGLNKIQNSLDQTFPWFRNITAWVLHALRGQLRLTETTGDPVVIRIPPILLVGPPGIGKTEWANSLADLLALPFEVLHLGGTATGVEYITSLSRWWKKPKPSRVLSFVAENQIANPLFLLDEIDKQAQDTRYGTVQQALLSYLDKNATNLYDDFLEGHIDVSRLNLIATANSIQKIDEPLCSRFAVVETPRPSPDHAEIILTRMYERFAEEMNVPVENIPRQSNLLTVVTHKLKAKKDLRAVWFAVRSALLEKITGVAACLPDTDQTMGFAGKISQEDPGTLGRKP